MSHKEIDIGDDGSLYNITGLPENPTFFGYTELSQKGINNLSSILPNNTRRKCKASSFGRAREPGQNKNRYRYQRRRLFTRMFWPSEAYKHIFKNYDKRLGEIQDRIDCLQRSHVYIHNRITKVENDLDELKKLHLQRHAHSVAYDVRQDGHSESYDV
jgi:hypothetical protein